MSPLEACKALRIFFDNEIELSLKYVLKRRLIML
jgi:hypothetical protein